MADDKEKKVNEPAPEGGMVQISASVLNGLLEDVKHLKERGASSRPIVARVTQHIATVKVLDEIYPVISIEKTWIENAHKPEEVTMCRIKYLKDIETKEEDGRTLPYLDFFNNVTGYKVEILEQKAEETVKSLGMVYKVNPDPVKMGDSGKSFRPGLVENEVKSIIYKSRVKFIEGPLEGKELEISNEWLNM